VLPALLHTANQRRIEAARRLQAARDTEPGALIPGTDGTLRRRIAPKAIGHVIWAEHIITEYRLPSTGELVPLLQIAPSKTDTERLLLVGPELADVLSAIVTRIRRPSGAIPMVAAYDAQIICGHKSIDTTMGQRPSTRPKRSRRTEHSSPDAGQPDPAKNTEPRPMTFVTPAKPRPTGTAGGDP
jgi:hypothetical protein